MRLQRIFAISANVVIALGFFFIVGNVHADVVTSNPNYDAYYSKNNFPTQTIQNLGTGLTGNLDKIYFLMQYDGLGSGTNATTYIRRCDDAAYSVNCSDVANSGGQTTFWNSDQSIQLGSTTISYSFNSLYYYQLKITMSGKLYGTTANTYAGGACSQDCGTLSDLYFILRTPANDNTRIISLDTPANSAVTPSEDVTIKFTYNYSTTDGTYNVGGISLYDLTTQTVVPTNTFTPVAGINQKTINVLLDRNHLYSWYAYLSNSSTLLANPVKSATLRFSTISDQNSILILQGSGTGTSTVNYELPSPVIASTTEAVSEFQQYINSYQNLPHIWSGMFPISWFWEISDVWNTNFQATSTTDNDLLIELDFSSSTASSTYTQWIPNYTLMSRSLFNKFMSDATILSIRSWIALALWVIACMAWFNLISSMFSNRIES